MSPDSQLRRVIVLSVDRTVALEDLLSVCGVYEQLHARDGCADPLSCGEWVDTAMMTV